MPLADDYFLTDRPVKVRGCDHPGCSAVGEHRAPKTRALDDYYWFCLDHVRQYNKAWDFFAGLSPSAIEDHIRNATVWERPTWPMGDWQKHEQTVRDKVHNEFFESDFTETKASPPMPVAEREAFQILGLVPPADFETIKQHYRALVKQHHPDANGGSAEAEEKFKSINQAFAVLKQIYIQDAAE